VIAARMTSRTGHFMPPSLLDSQFSTLELPQSDELAVTVDIDQTPAAIITKLVARCAKETI
jgi:gluconokinase